MDTFIVNGCSAGGLATYTWVDTVREWIHAVNPKVKVYGIADAGFFVDYASNKTGKHDYATNIKVIVDMVNVDVPLPNKVCVADNPTNP